MRKQTLKVGDKVNHKDYPDVDGVIVFKLDEDNPYNTEKNEWNVHFNINATIGDRRFCKSEELIKAKPKLGITKNDIENEKPKDNENSDNER